MLMWKALFVSWAACSFGSWRCCGQVAPGSTPPPDVSDVGLQIEAPTSQPVYRIGETLRLELAFTASGPPQFQLQLVPYSRQPMRLGDCRKPGWGGQRYGIPAVRARSSFPEGTSRGVKTQSRPGPGNQLGYARQPAVVRIQTTREPLTVVRPPARGREPEPRRPSRSRSRTRSPKNPVPRRALRCRTGRRQSFPLCPL